MQIRCLGPLGVSDPARDLPLGGPKQRLVLAHLLVRANATVPADQLITEVWDGDPPRAARSSLHTYISHLRRTLGADRIVGDGAGYALHVAPEEVDSARFAALVTRGRRLRTTDPDAAAAVLAEAMDLWRGPPFADLAGAASLQPEITRLEELRLTAVEERMGARLDAGGADELVGELEVLTSQHPLRERLWGQLVTALYRADRQGDALAAYERARRHLAGELGIDPSDELRSVHERVLRQDPSLRAATTTLRGYRLLERIGQGSFGIVWRATQPGADRDVAVKVARPELANDPTFIRRFEIEARRAARIEHPHVVPLYDVWREPDGAYVVMRYLRGGTLRDRLSAGDLHDDDTTRVALQICDGLAAAHSAGVVHGAITSTDVLLDDAGNAYISDLGLAAARADGHSADINRSSGDGTGRRDDVAAVGGLLTELLGDADEAVATVLDRATSDDRDRRYPDAGALLADLRRALGRATAAAPEALDARGDVGAVRNPYKGLRPFTEVDAGDFFGRTAAVAQLLTHLRDGGRFVAVVGPSGSGKSSVVRAGLVPALRAGALPASQTWFIAQMVPGDHPFDELATALQPVAVDPPGDLADRLCGEQGFATATALLPDDAALLVVIDQFEELFTLVADDDRRQRFIATLVDAVSSADSRIRVVVTLRADCYDRPLAHADLGALMQAHTATLLPLRTDEIERAVAAPAERVGVAVDRSLVAQLVADVTDQPSALPLLQYALTELFDARDGATLTSATYREIGGIAGALRRRAEASFTALDDAGRAAVRQLFLRLVTPGEGVEDTRRRALVSDVTQLAPDTMPAVLDAFGDARLLSFDRDPDTRAPTVEVAHEALLREWPRLHSWIDAARDDLRTHRRLQAAAADWISAGRDASFLATGSRLESYASWRDTSGLALGEDERAYLDASVTHSDRLAADEAARAARERALERRSIRRLRVLVAVLGVAALVAGGLTVFATAQGRRAADEAARAEREALGAARAARVATARELAAAADANLDDDPERSMLLALQAIDTTRATDGTALREAEEALHRAVHESRVTLRVPDVGGALDWSPDGETFVTEGPEDSGTIDIRDATTGASVRSWRGHDVDVNDVQYSADGTVLATAGDDGAVRLWDPTTGDLRFEHTEPVGEGDDGSVRGMAVNDDGSMVAAVWMLDQTLRIVDVDTGEVVARVEDMGAEGGPFRSAFSPDGRELAVPSVFGQRVRIVEAATGRQRRVLHRGGFPVTVAWSPDGRWLAVADAETSGVQVHDAESGDVHATLRGHTAEIRELDWSTDTRRLASASGDGTVRIWEIDGDGGTEALVLTSEGMAGGVQGVAFSPDGAQVMGGEGDISRVLTWDVTQVHGGEWATMASNANGAWDPLVTAPDGRHVITAGPSRSVTMWDPRDGRMIREYGGDQPAHFVSAGDGLVVAGRFDGGDVTAWDTGTGDELFATGVPNLTDVAASGDGRFVAIARPDDDVRILDRSGAQVARLAVSAEHTALAVVLSSDGSVAAVIEEPDRPTPTYPVRLWDVERRRVVHDMRLDAVNLALSPDAALLAVAQEDGTASVWSVEDGTLSTMLSGHLGSVLSAAFSADGSTIATTGRDSTVRVWDVATGTPRLVLPGHDVLSAGAAFTADGRMLASAGFDGVTRVWALDLDDLITIAQEKVTRDLTEAECREYLHVDACP